MRKLVVVLALVVGLTVPIAAYSADLNPNQKDKYSCPDGGVWHFVNVRPGTTTKAFLTASFSGGDVTKLADKVNGGTQHWWIDAEGSYEGAANAYGTLENATTGSATAGFIVLSDYACYQKKSEK